MAATIVGIVYDARTLALRRIIIPDDDSQLDTSHPLGPWEVLLKHPRANGLHLDAAMAAIRLRTGRDPPTLEQIHTLGL